MLVEGDRVLEMPPFFHDFSADNKSHVFKGNGAMHVSIERVLLKIREFVQSNGDAPFFSIVDLALDIAFGLNCNFPPRDVVSYVIWSFKINRMPPGKHR